MRVLVAAADLHDGGRSFQPAALALPLSLDRAGGARTLPLSLDPPPQLGPCPLARTLLLSLDPAPYPAHRLQSPMRWMA